MILNVGVCAVFVFIGIFQCKPLSYFWERFDPSKKGMCILPEFGGAAFLSIAVVATAIDLSLGVLPILIVKDLQMARREKISVGCILGLGSMYVGPLPTCSPCSF